MVGNKSRAVGRGNPAARLFVAEPVALVGPETGDGGEAFRLFTVEEPTDDAADVMQGNLHLTAGAGFLFSGHVFPPLDLDLSSNYTLFLKAVNQFSVQKARFYPHFGHSFLQQTRGKFVIIAGYLLIIFYPHAS